MFMYLNRMQLYKTCTHNVKVYCKSNFIMISYLCWLQSQSKLLINFFIQVLASGKQKIGSSAGNDTRLIDKSMVYIIHKYWTSQEGRARSTHTCTGGWASLFLSPQYTLETRDDRRLWGQRPDSLAFGPLRTEPLASAHSPGNLVLGQGFHRRHSRGWLHFQEPAYRQCHCKGHMSLEAYKNKFYF